MADKNISFDQIDFENEKEDLKNFLKNQDILKDYNFEGSNINILLDILAYNSFKHNFFDNMVYNESNIHTANIRSSVVSKAKELNYIPRSSSSAKAVVNVNIFPVDNPSTITIPKYSYIKTSIDSRSVKFMTNTSITVTKDDSNNYVAKNVIFYEGELVTEKFLVESETNDNITKYKNRFILQSENIDTSSIEVSVKSSNDNEIETEYSLSKNIYNINNESKIYFLQGANSYQYEIEFGDGVFGKSLSTGNVVIVRYRDTIGSVANGAYNFSKVGSYGDYSNITIETVTPAYGGSPTETTQSIAKNAPRNYQRQQRTVTERDYTTAIKEEFPEVQNVNAFGGEKIQKYGKVIIAIKPYGVIGVPVNSLKKRIENYLKLQNMTTEPVVTNPEYFYLKIDGKVYYDRNSTDVNVDKITSNVIQKLESLNNTLFNDFDINIEYSRITRAIDDSDKLIRSNDINLSIFKQWSPPLNTTTSIKINFNNKLDRETNITNKYFDYETPVIKSNNFYYLDNNKAIPVSLEDDGTGNISIFSFDNDSKKFVVKNNVGTVNYETGEVFIKMIVENYSNPIEIYAKTKDKNILINNENFVILDGKNINIRVLKDYE